MTCAVVGLLGVAPAAAADEGLLRFAHLSPDTPAVDVALTPLPAGETTTDPGPDVATDLAYGGIGAFEELAPGSYAVSLRAAGSPPTTPPVLTTRIEVRPGSAATVALAGTFADAGLQVLADDLSAPPPGSARIRVLDAAASADPLDATLADGTVLALPGPAAPVPAGPATLRVSGGDAVPLELPAGAAVTLLLLDRPEGGVTVRVVLDAAGPAPVPAGAVEAGGGPGSPAVLGAGALVALAALGSRRGRVLVTAASAGAALLVLPTAPAAASAAVTPPSLEPLADAAAPASLSLPSIGAESPLPALGLTADGALLPPADPAVAGWYGGSAAPGEPGPAVVVGHVDWAGEPGVFARLDELAVGDPVLVRRADGTTAEFAVTRVERYAKDAFPTQAVYGTTTGSELRLITCGGAFDRARGSYVDNVVVFAALTDG